MGVAKEVGEVDGVVDELAVGGYDAVVVGIGDNACAVVDDFDPFGFRTKDDTGLFEEEGFFLHTAAVGHHQSRVLLHECHLKERERLEDTYQWFTGEELAVSGSEFVASARMQRQYDRDVVLASYVDEGTEYLLQTLRIVGVVVAVYGGKYVSFSLQRKLLHDVATCGSHLGEMDAIVVHHVATINDTSVQSGVLCEKAFFA